MDILLYTLLAIIILLLLPRNIAKWVLAIVVAVAIIGAVVFLILTFVPNDFNWGEWFWIILFSGVIVPALWEFDKMQKKKKKKSVDSAPD